MLLEPGIVTSALTGPDKGTISTSSGRAILFVGWSVVGRSPGITTRFGSRKEFSDRVRIALFEQFFEPFQRLRKFRDCAQKRGSICQHDTPPHFGRSRSHAGAVAKTAGTKHLLGGGLLRSEH